MPSVLKRWLKQIGATPVVFGGRTIAIGLDMYVYHRPEKFKQKEFIKMNMWKITKVTENFVELKKDEETTTLDAKTFNSIFDYTFCLTTHKAQGATIRDHFNVYEVY